MIDSSTFVEGQPAPADVFVGSSGELVDKGAKGATQVIVKGVELDRGAMIALGAAVDVTENGAVRG